MGLRAPQRLALGAAASVEFSSNSPNLSNFRLEKSAPFGRILVIDEAWALLSDLESLTWLRSRFNLNPPMGCDLGVAGGGWG